MRRGAWRPPGLAALAVLVGPGVSAAPDTTSWVCRYCPFETGHESRVEGEISHVSDDASRFGDARGYDEQGVYANLGGSGRFVSGPYRLGWFGEDLGLDARQFTARAARPGAFRIDVDYRELPQHRFDSTRTVFLQSGDNSLLLPPGWVRAPVTGGFTALDTALVDRRISSDRRELGIEARYLLFEGLRVSAGYRRQERHGVRIAGGSWFTQSSLLPAPFEFATDEAELALRYETSAGFLRLGWFGSFFQNENLALFWETPFTAGSGGDGALAQEPDNSFRQLFFSGIHRFAVADAVLGFNAAAGRGEQDDTLLPYTVNSSVATMTLPRQRLDGRIDTRQLSVTLAARPLARGRVTLGYRLDERDNETPVTQWNRVIVDTFNSGESEDNVPYGFRRVRVDAGGRYRLLDTLTLGGGYRWQRRERDFQEVAEQTEEEGWGMLHWRPGGWLDLRAKGGASERDVDWYDEGFAVSLGQNPLLRKYHLAYRYRRFGELTAAAAIPDKPLSATLSALYADDEYTQSRLGLTAGDDLRIAADIGLTLGEGRSLYVTAGYERMQSDQLGSEQLAAPDWSARHTDRFHTFGGGLAIREIAGAFHLRVDYTRAVGSTDISINSLASGAGFFPQLESVLDSLTARLTWRASERLALHAGLRYEGFRVDDWTLEGVAPDTVPVVLTLGALPWDYDVILIRVGFAWTLGGNRARQAE